MSRRNVSSRAITGANEPSYVFIEIVNFAANPADSPFRSLFPFAPAPLSTNPEVSDAALRSPIAPLTRRSSRDGSRDRRGIIPDWMTWRDYFRRGFKVTDGRTLVPRDRL